MDDASERGWQLREMVDGCKMQKSGESCEWPLNESGLINSINYAQVHYGNTRATRYGLRVTGYGLRLTGSGTHSPPDAATGRQKAEGREAVRSAERGPGHANRHLNGKQRTPNKGKTFIGSPTWAIHLKLYLFGI